MESTETTMKRPNGSTALLTLFLGLSLVSLALARSHRDTPALPRLVATVISLDSRGLATIRTEDGATYQLVKGLWWGVGDKVECQQNNVKQGLLAQGELDCRSVLFGD
jgi:hypothetical protein